MRALLQRVSSASVIIEGEVVSSIGKGLLILLGAKDTDDEAVADYIAKKAAELRIFSDENDKMNLSLLDIEGEVLVVSQFTLYADCKKGRRPSFTGAGDPAKAEKLYEYFCKKIYDAGVQNVKTGQFGADMKVSIVNDGPVTIMLDSDSLKNG